MKKIDFKLVIVGIIGVLASFLAFSVSSFLGFAVFATFAVLSMLIVNLVAPYGERILFAALVIAVPGFTYGVVVSLCAALFFILPAVAMAEIIRITKDFSITICSGTGVFCAGVAVVDRLFLVPEDGGIRIAYSAYIDSVEKGFVGIKDIIAQAYGEALTVDLMAVVKNTCYVLKLMFPGFLIIFAIAIMFFALMMSKKFIANIPIPRFSYLIAPKALVYAYFLCYAIGYFSIGNVSDFVISNVSLVLSAVLMMCGLSLVRFLTRLIPSKLLSGVVFVFLIPLSLSFSSVLIMAGAADALFNFRRLRNEKR